MKEKRRGSICLSEKSNAFLLRSTLKSTKDSCARRITRSTTTAFAQGFDDASSSSGVTLITVRSSKPPVVEIDTEIQSAYVRFSSNRVARTVVPDEDEGHVITIDLDQNGRVVGVEPTGVTEFGIRNLLHKPPISVPPELLDKARYIAAQKRKALAAA